MCRGKAAKPARLPADGGIIVTKHAREQYRRRIDPSASDAEIESRMEKAAKKASLRRARFAGSQYFGGGVAFAAKIDGGKVVVTTVFGDKKYYEWTRRTHNKAVKRVAPLWGSRP